MKCGLRLTEHDAFCFWILHYPQQQGVTHMLLMAHPMRFRELDLLHGIYLDSVWVTNAKVPILYEFVRTEGLSWRAYTGRLLGRIVEAVGAIGSHILLDINTFLDVIPFLDMCQKSEISFLAR